MLSQRWQLQALSTWLLLPEERDVVDHPYIRHSCWVLCVFEQGLQLNYLRLVSFAEGAPVLPRGGSLAVCAMDAGSQTSGPSPAVFKEKTLGG